MLRLEDDPGAFVALGGQDLVEEVAAGAGAVGGDGGEHPGGARGDEGEGVDLAVGVREGDADLGAPVLEAVDLLDPLAGGEFGGAVDPCGEDERGAVLVELGEGGQVVGVKQTTSQRPVSPAREGKRFSKTATS